MFKDKFNIIDFFKNMNIKGVNISTISTKYKVLIGIFLLIFSVSLFYILKGNDESIRIVEVSVRTVNYREEELVELINEGDNLSNIYTNGELVEYGKKIPSKGKAMELPKVEGVLDIEKKEKVRELTYKASLEESAKYINFLIQEGYNILREAYTSEYIEFYMTKGTEERRIIILNNIIMVGELGESWKLPDVSSYFE